MKIKTVAGLVVVGFIGISAGMVLSTGRHSHGQVTSVAQPQGAELPKDPPGTAPLRSNARDVRTILTLLSNGAIVRNGDVVCELDSAELAESMTNQRIATIHAQTTHRRNETALEIARLNLDEYEKGVTVLEQQEMQAAVDKAEADLGAAEGRFAATKSDKDETARRDARTALELAQSRRDVLLHYTKAKRIKELKLAIEVAEAEVQASAQVGMLEQSKEKAIEREIAACTMVASRDGKLVYYYGAEGSKPRIGYKPDGSTAPWPFIGVGAQVLPQQLLFKVIPVDEDPARSR